MAAAVAPSIPAPASPDRRARLLALSHSVRPTPDEVRTDRRRLQAKAGVIASLALGSYAGLALAPVGLGLRVLFAGALVIACVVTATSVMHDANHGAFARSTSANRIVGFSSDLLGASSFVWRFKHNSLHHANTNVVGIDTDIDQMPFARLAPQHRWRPWHRYQHLYMWVLYGFVALRWFLVADFATLLRGKVSTHRLPSRRRRDTAFLLLGKLAHLGWAVLIPLALHPWWGVLAFYLTISWSVGFLLANIFQVAHCVEEAEFMGAAAGRRGPDFALHQLRTTVDVRCTTPFVGGFVRWLMGGLDCQIEHHLAPRLPHATLRRIAARLQAACAVEKIPYRTHSSPLAGLRAHARWLRLMGEQPA